MLRLLAIKAAREQKSARTLAQLTLSARIKRGLDPVFLPPAAAAPKELCIPSSQLLQWHHPHSCRMAAGLPSIPHKHEPAANTRTERVVTL